MLQIWRRDGDKWDDTRRRRHVVDKDSRNMDGAARFSLFRNFNTLYTRFDSAVLFFEILQTLGQIAVSNFFLKKFDIWEINLVRCLSSSFIQEVLKNCLESQMILLCIE